MNIDKLIAANLEIESLKAELEQHDDQITNIEEANKEISDVANDKILGLKAMVNALLEVMEIAYHQGGDGILINAIDKTPAQCLANVKADAVKAYVDSFDGNCTVMVYKSWIKKDGAHYANKLREQK
jgi:hypothetical protein